MKESFFRRERKQAYAVITEYLSTQKKVSLDFLIARIMIDLGFSKRQANDVINALKSIGDIEIIHNSDLSDSAEGDVVIWKGK